MLSSQSSPSSHGSPQRDFSSSATRGSHVPQEAEHFGNASSAAAPSGNIRQGAEAFRNVPQSSESFGNTPHGSAEFRTRPYDAENLRTIPQTSESSANAFNTVERNENHTLTVREVARMFEAAGVARTERSIVNWCQPNRAGLARLDAYFDPNERKYFISAQSVDAAVQEELAKTARAPVGEPVVHTASETFGSAPKRDRGTTSTQDGSSERSGADEERVKELEREVMDLKIANRGKDYFIEQLQKERDGFQTERQGYLEKLMGFSRKVGELSTKLFQIERGTQIGSTHLPNSASEAAQESFDRTPNSIDEKSVGAPEI